MQTFETKKIWFILMIFDILVFGISGCIRSLEITDIPELPVRTNPPPTAVPTLTDGLVDETEVANNPYCSGEDFHPIGESISQTFDVTYEEVMRLYCSGFTFDNILLAFTTSQQTDYEYNPRELLQMKLTMSWDEIWNDIGIIEDK